MLIFGFHRVERITGLEITRLSPRRFGKILEVLESSGQPISPVADAVDRPGIGLTFDDGFASVAESALPIVAARGLHATVFLVAGSVGRSDQWDVRLLGRSRPMMNWQQARYWSNRGCTFGSHTLTHPDLTVLTPRALRLELESSKQMIEDRLGQPVTALSYPFGRHNQRVREAAKAAGYSAAFGTYGSGSERDPFAINRVLVNSLMSVLEIRSLLDAYRRDGVLNEHWRGHWRNRFLSSLSAGSATVSAWQRCMRRQGQAQAQFENEQNIPVSSRWR